MGDQTATASAATASAATPAAGGFQRIANSIPSPILESPKPPSPDSAPPASPSIAATTQPGKPPEAGKPPETGKPTENTTDDLKLSERLANLRRREATLAEQRLTFQRQSQEREARFKENESKLDALRQELENIRKERDAAKADPLKWLEFGGHNYESASRQMLNKGQPLPEQETKAAIQAQQAEIERIRRETQEALKHEAEERQRILDEQKAERERANRQQFSEFRQSTIDFVSSNKDKYQLVNSLGRQDEVAQLIAERYQSTLEADVPLAKEQGRQPIGEILSQQRAAELLEEFYQKQLAAVESTDYFKSKYKLAEQATPAGGATPPVTATSSTPAAPAAAPSNQAPPPAVTTPPVPVTFQRTYPGQHPTVTNQIVTQGATPVNGQSIYLSEDERMKRAVAAMQAVEQEKLANRRQ